MWTPVSSTCSDGFVFDVQRWLWDGSAGSLGRSVSSPAADWERSCGPHFVRWSAALREKPDLGKEKLTWLQRHDQDCGSLYGVLPLCIGMPVAATDHLDRTRGILRGCAGEIVGWVWHAEAVGGASQEATQIWNELPACILVRFKTKTTWRVEGIDEDNVFPVAPQKKPWYLDKGRKRPVLRVTRKQFPLAPGFAATAHAAQGQTCKEGVVMDMHIGEAGDPLTAYIALTRVQDRYGLFVYRPFPAAPFQKGARVGRELLLRFWGGEKMDWRALRAKYRDERQCKECIMKQSQRLHSRLVDGNEQMRREYAKNAFVGTLRRSSRGNAWLARPGNRKMHSRQNMQGHKPHFIVFVKRANRHKCVVFAIRTWTKRNFLAGPGNEHAGAVECV